MNKITLKRKASLTAIAAGIAFTAFRAAVAADQPATPVHIRGTVLAVTDTGFTVQTLAGTQTIAVAPATKITGVVPSSLNAIKSGTFIGTANVPGASGARALEVVVFPDAMILPSLSISRLVIAVACPTKEVSTTPAFPNVLSSFPVEV